MPDKSIFLKELDPNNMIVNPPKEELRKLAKKDERTTEYGSAAYITVVRSRSAKFTEIIFGDPNEEQAQIINEVQEYLKWKTMIRIDRQMCLHPDHVIHARLYLTEEYARIAYMWKETLFEPKDPDGTPDMISVYVPEWRERKVLVQPELKVSYVLGTDYLGENKKAHLRMGMYIAKERGGLGLHAGSKLIRVKKKDGQMVEKGAILFGLSGTGKTSLSCHNHGLAGDEGIAIRQDDVVFIQPDTYCVGTENNYYIKTEGLEPKGQALLYAAATKQDAILENIWVDRKSGKVDFFDEKITSNGRCVVYRKDIDYTDDKVDLPKADIIIFITRRNDVVPPVARLTPEQGAAFFMLGESIETSAGDPTQAGKSKRVVGTNPFIVGDLAEEGNIFYNILKDNPESECFLLNTGRVGGPKGEDITIQDSSAIMKEIARGEIEWEVDPEWGYEVAVKVPGIDIGRLDPKRFYDEKEYKRLTEILRKEREAWLFQFENLDPEILSAI
jgi:phosphoenolpyruvate carboxykinase (ATP)